MSAMAACHLSCVWWGRVCCTFDTKTGAEQQHLLRYAAIYALPTCAQYRGAKREIIPKRASSRGAPNLRPGDGYRGRILQRDAEVESCSHNFLFIPEKVFAATFVCLYFRQAGLQRTDIHSFRRWWLRLRLNPTLGRWWLVLGLHLALAYPPGALCDWSDRQGCLHQALSVLVVNVWRNESAKLQKKYELELQVIQLSHLNSANLRKKTI